jgi:hypothetical protein
MAWVGPQVRRPAAQALRALADAGRAVTVGRSDWELTTMAADAVGHVAATFRARPPDATSHPDLLVTSNVVTALRRSLRSSAAATSTTSTTRDLQLLIFTSA